MPHNPQRFWLAALIVAWSVDFLFWEKPAGISFVIIVVLALAAGFWLAWSEKMRPAHLSYVLGGLVVLLASVTILRSEGFARGLNGALALLGMGLLVLTLPSGAWVRFKMLDYLAGGFELLVVGLTRAAGTPIFPKNSQGDAGNVAWQRAVPVLRGLFLALPVVLVLGSLLASADLVFAEQLKEFIKVFDFGHLPEYFARLFYILVLMYVLTGMYLYAVLPRPVFGAFSALTAPKAGQAPAEQAPAGQENADALGSAGQAEAARTVSTDPLRFLGATETFIVLGSVDLLFAFFVTVQFRYFFGGSGNINLTGYTYSEYARRGFFELVTVAVLSLLLYLFLNRLTKRTRPMDETIFTGLSVLLVGLVLVILISAFQRLLLYEDAYGFTSLRTYTHIFIPWLAFLLVATILMQITRREIYFGALLLLCVFGFGLTFAVLNVDGFIADQNIRRAVKGESLDSRYLLSLSADALPVIVREYQRPDQKQVVRDSLGQVLACRTYQIGMETPLPWQSYHAGQALARRTLIGVDLRAYRVQIIKNEPMVRVNNQWLDCRAVSTFD